jgi:hypothetical protein
MYNKLTGALQAAPLLPHAARRRSLGRAETLVRRNTVFVRDVGDFNLRNVWRPKTSASTRGKVAQEAFLVRFHGAWRQSSSSSSLWVLKQMYTTRWRQDFQGGAINFKILRLGERR